jgi:hypothetical protein
VRYTHRQTGITGTVDWQTDYEVGIEADGWTWTGSWTEFYKQWEAT